MKQRGLLHAQQPLFEVSGFESRDRAAMWLMRPGVLHVTCNTPFLYNPRQIHGVYIVEIVLDEADEIMDVFGDVVVFIIGQV